MNAMRDCVSTTYSGGTKMTLLEILLNCPDDIFNLVNDARIAVLNGEWHIAARHLDAAAESGHSELHKACGELSDTFYKRAKA